MDKMDMMKAYELFEYCKKAVVNLGRGFEIKKEESTSNAFWFSAETKNGLDGAPARTCYFVGETFVSNGKIEMIFDFSENHIIFNYLFPGFGGGALYNSKIGVDSNGDPVFKNPLNMIGLNKLKSDWEAEHIWPWLHWQAGKEGFSDGPVRYLEFFMNCGWDFNENDTFDAFKDELTKIFDNMGSNDFLKLVQEIQNKYQVPEQFL